MFSKNTAFSLVVILAALASAVSEEVQKTSPRRLKEPNKQNTCGIDCSKDSDCTEKCTSCKAIGNEPKMKCRHPED